MHSIFYKKSNAVASLFALSLIFIFQSAIAQGPSISMVGNSPSLSKGTINTDVLSEIIQQKQEELNQRIFRNVIINNFKKTSYESHFNNFSTFYYVYNLMNNLTSGKNKTIITKSIIESSTEFAYVFGLAFYVQESLALQKKNIRVGAYELNQVMFDNIQVNFDKNEKFLRLDTSLKSFNLLIDMCYDVILKDTSTSKKFQFKENLTSKSFASWYNMNNAYVLEKENASVAEQKNLDSLYSYIEQSYAQLKQLVKKAESVANTNQYPYNLNAGDNTSIILFYTNLRKSDFQEFILNQSQYYAMKFLITQFNKLTNNQTENNIVNKLISATIENVMLEYYTSNNLTPVLERDTNTNVKAYLYLNVESIISEIYQKIDYGKNTGMSVYITPFLSIGTNYAYFPNSNNLIKNDNGSTNTLAKLYFASEKIGLKYKIWNWEYTHSHGIGDNFKYYNFKKDKSRYWKRPQIEPLVSNVHLIAYGSGLLYNIANLKSTESFNYAIVGSAIGVTFFNGLSANVGLAVPYTDKKLNSNNMFLNFGVDIPIVEYISKLRSN